MTNFPGLNLPNVPFQLPGGWTLMPPAVPGGTASTAPIQQLPFSLPGFPQGGAAPDLSGILTALTPIISAAVPQLAPFLPIIGVVLNILHALTTQNTAAIQSGQPNQALQMVHDAAWSQVLGAFAPKATTAGAVG